MKTLKLLIKSSFFNKIEENKIKSNSIAPRRKML